MSDDRLNYHRRKFEDEVLAKKQEPKCRLWDNQGVQDIIEQLCDPKGTFLKANRSLKHFEVFRDLRSKGITLLRPISNKSLKVVAFEDLFDQLYWA